MTNLTNAQLEDIIASITADANNFAFSVESRDLARKMVKRYERELAKRELAAYYGPLPTHYSDGSPTGA